MSTLKDFAQTEVGHLQVAFHSEEKVARLQVAVDHLHVAASIDARQRHERARQGPSGALESVAVIDFKGV